MFNLVVSAAIVSLEISFFLFLPLIFKGLRKSSNSFAVFGAMVLFGFCFFDLIPEMVEIGGVTSLIIIGVSWVLFSVLHHFQAHHSQRDESYPDNHQSGFVLLITLAIHCFAGGMLLVSSYEISEKLAGHVFVGLLAHKAFEAIAVATAILDKASTFRQLLACKLFYAISFPLGVASTIFARYWASDLSKDRIEMIAMVLTSVAVGSLLGCLVQDYLLPLFKRGTLALKANLFRSGLVVDGLKNEFFEGVEKEPTPTHTKDNTH